MSSPTPIYITLDRKREVRWTKRAIARNASLARPVSFAGLSRGRNRIYVVCALIWAALIDRDHEFESPEDLAEYFTTEEQQLGALKAIREMVADAFPEKKTSDSESSSESGQVPSPKESPEVQSGGT